MGVDPAARVHHDYAFAKGPAKWRALERNRWATIVRCYPGPLLAAVAPALLVLELALWPAALAGGWGGEKARASLDVLGALPRLLRERREIQATRTVSPARFADGLTADLSSPYLGALGRSRALSSPCAPTGGACAAAAQELSRPERRSAVCARSAGTDGHTSGRGGRRA